MRKFVRDAATAATVAAATLVAAGCQPQQPAQQQQQQGRLNDGSAGAAAAASSSIHPSALDVTGPAGNGTPMYKPAAFHPTQSVVPPEEPAITTTPVLDMAPAAAPHAHSANLSVTTKAHAKAPAATPSKLAIATSGNAYKVKKGDTLFAIARAHYGDGKQWQRIAAANPGVSPASLRVGQMLALPQ
jgi:nucleoid-associated protein YgaU